VLTSFSSEYFSSTCHAIQHIEPPIFLTKGICSFSNNRPWKSPVIYWLCPAQSSSDIEYRVHRTLRIGKQWRATVSPHLDIRRHEVIRNPVLITHVRHLFKIFDGIPYAQPVRFDPSCQIPISLWSPCVPTPCITVKYRPTTIFIIWSHPLVFLL